MASPMGSPLKLQAVKVPEVPEIAKLTIFFLISRGKLSRSFSQELIQELGFLKPYWYGTEFVYFNSFL